MRSSHFMPGSGCNTHELSAADNDALGLWASIIRGGDTSLYRSMCRMARDRRQRDKPSFMAQGTRCL
jgi:hypothetical protein